jgi:hypothetical protein
MSMADFQYADVVSKDVGDFPEVDGPYGPERSPMSLLPPLFSKQDEPQDYSFKQLAPSSASLFITRVRGPTEGCVPRPEQLLPINRCDHVSTAGAQQMRASQAGAKSTPIVPASQQVAQAVQKEQQQPQPQQPVQQQQDGSPALR